MCKQTITTYSYCGHYELYMLWYILHVQQLLDIYIHSVWTHKKKRTHRTSMKLQHLGSMLFWGCVFENVFSPKGWPENLPKWWKFRNVWLLSVTPWFQPFPYTNSMQKPPRIHSNTSPTRFEICIFLAEVSFARGCMHSSHIITMCLESSRF